VVLRAVDIKIRIYLPEFVFRLRVWIALRCRKMRWGYPFRKIQLTRGQYAIVDPERYEELAKYKWHVSWSRGGKYAVRPVRSKKGGKYRQTIVRMHRVIIGAREGEIVDHINHNGLDDRIANLRIATPRQNNWNTRKRRCNCSSKYKGVHWSREMRKWRARIKFNGRTILIGDYDDERAAARAYDVKARELFGEFAWLNLAAGPGVGRRQKLRKYIRKRLIDRLRLGGKIQWLAKLVSSGYN